MHVSDVVSETGGSGQAGALLVASDGGVFALGQAAFAGSLPDLGVHASDIVAGSATSNTERSLSIEKRPTDRLG